MENLNYKIIEFDLETISDELLNKYFDFEKATNANSKSRKKIL